RKSAGVSNPKLDMLGHGVWTRYMPSIDVSVGEPKTISRKQVQFRGSWGTFRGLQPFASAYGERLNFKTCPTGCPLRWHSLRTPFSESSGQTPMPGPRDLSACGCSARA